MPEASDLISVQLVGLRGKHKLADNWECERYEVIRKPNPTIPAYIVKRCDGEGHERTLHRSMLFPLALPQAYRTADELGARAKSDTDAESSGSDPRMQTRSGKDRVEEQISSESEDDVRYTEVTIDDSDHNFQARNAPVTPSQPSAEEPNSDDDTSEQEDENVSQLRQSTRNKQLP